MKSSKAILLGKRFYHGWLYLIFTVALAFQGTVTFSRYDLALNRGQAEFNADMVLQVGAFQLEQNALALKNRLSAYQGKPVTIISEDGYYKVRLSGFKSPEELEKILPSLGLLGIR
ncbi:MAG: SPOR domain-containing protein, partial [Bacteroidales bacterium]